MWFIFLGKAIFCSLLECNHFPSILLSKGCCFLSPSCVTWLTWISFPFFFSLGETSIWTAGIKASSTCGDKVQWWGRELITLLKLLMFCFYHFASHDCISTNKQFLSLTYMLQLFVKFLPHTVIITNNCFSLKVILFIFWFMLQEKLKLDAEREKLERLQELYSEQKTQLDNCPESMREQLQQQLKRVSSEFQD